MEITTIANPFVGMPKQHSWLINSSRESERSVAQTELSTESL
jgi:hypothetical protein